jgi:hypothetical protein
LWVKMTSFWDVPPCSLVEVYRRFRGACFLHLRACTRLHCASSQMTVIFILAAVRTWILIITGGCLRKSGEGYIT